MSYYYQFLTQTLYLKIKNKKKIKKQKIIKLYFPGQYRPEKFGINFQIFKIK